MNFRQFCQNKTRTIVIIGALLACIGSNQSKAASIEPPASAAVAADHFQVGSMHVALLGNPKGKPVILIPGLASGPWVWDDTVKQLQQDHALYLVTLAGFNGKAPISGSGSMMEQARQSLHDLIRTKKIEQPILIGHSLGATLSIWFAAQHPALIRGVFAVDGLPVFPRTENMSPEQRQTMAQGMKVQMAAMTQTQEMFAASQLQYMQNIGVVNPDLAKTVAVRSATSDRAAVAQYMSEVLAMDIRKDLPAITVPVAIVVPYHAPDMAAAGITEQAKAAYYGALLAGTPKLQVLPIKDARHFVMLDQPTVFAEKLAGFIQTLK
jgi:pimeloyl-ACP methyl ester carboxylesterase